MWIGHLLLLFFPLYGRGIEGARLLVAAGGSIHFGCQHPAPRRIRSREHPFRTATVNKNILVRSIRAKKRDSKPSADKKSDIGKWDGAVDQQRRI